MQRQGKDPRESDTGEHHAAKGGEAGELPNVANLQAFNRQAVHSRTEASKPSRYLEQGASQSPKNTRLPSVVKACGIVITEAFVVFSRLKRFLFRVSNEASIKLAIELSRTWNFSLEKPVVWCRCVF